MRSHNLSIESYWALCGEMTEDSPDGGVDDVFNDTCVLFDYAIDAREESRRLFDERTDVEKVVSPRIKREFESVSKRQQDIHRELLEFATSGELDDYEANSLKGQSNDLSYVIDLYSELLEFDDTVEVVRRLNELINRLEKVHEELFGSDELVTVLDIDGLDPQLKGLLSVVVSNDDDVRVLCDAVAWRRKGGSGTFLTEDTEDILGKDDGTESDDSSDGVESRASNQGGLPDSFEDFLSGGEEKPLPEQINEQITLRYDHSARLRIMSVSEFLQGRVNVADESRP